jgi:BMFP domain-containing protein YqiC
MFDTAVNEAVDQRVKITVDNELTKMDESHSAQMSALLEMIDTDHLARTKAFVESMDASYAQKLAVVIERGQKLVDQEAKELRESINATVSNYLDLYLDRAFPAEVVKEAVENTRARHLLEKIRDVVGLDESFISESVKGAVVDGYAQIQDLKTKLETALRESQELTSKLDKTQASLVLEQKTAGLPGPKRDFARRLLEGKSAEEINENFSYVLDLYTKEELDARTTVASQTQSRVVTEKLDTPAKIVTKVEDKPAKNSDVAFCLEAMKHS